MLSILLCLLNRYASRRSDRIADRKTNVRGDSMRIVQAFGEPCCSCGSRHVVVEPVHLIGACADCSSAVIAERRWNDRIGKAVSRNAVTPAAKQGHANFVGVHSGEAAAGQPRPLFGRLPPRQIKGQSQRTNPKHPEQLTFPGF